VVKTHTRGVEAHERDVEAHPGTVEINLDQAGWPIVITNRARGLEFEALLTKYPFEV
jgi:hypothetical protein